jgi:hypothetical protein
MPPFLFFFGVLLLGSILPGRNYALDKVMKLSTKLV